MAGHEVGARAVGEPRPELGIERLELLLSARRRSRRTCRHRPGTVRRSARRSRRRRRPDGSGRARSAGLPAPRPSSSSAPRRQVESLAAGSHVDRAARRRVSMRVIDRRNEPVQIDDEVGFLQRRGVTGGQFEIVRFGSGRSQVRDVDERAADLLGDELQRVERCDDVEHGRRLHIGVRRRRFRRRHPLRSRRSRGTSRRATARAPRVLAAAGRACRLIPPDDNRNDSHNRPCILASPLICPWARRP